MEKEIVKYKINWKTRDNILRFVTTYDEETDTFFAHLPEKKPAISIDCNGEFWIRVDPNNGEILGIEIEGFKSAFLKKHPEITRQGKTYIKPLKDFINVEMCPA